MANASKNYKKSKPPRKAGRPKEIRRPVIASTCVEHAELLALKAKFPGLSRSKAIRRAIQECIDDE